MTAERERLISQIHQIDTWITLLGMDGIWSGRDGAGYTVPTVT